MNGEWAQRVARLGYASRGIVYLMIGGLTVVAAVGGGKAAGSKDALRALLGTPLGTMWVAAIASGLLFFALWRVTQCVLDTDHLGRGRKGIFRRVSYGASSIVYA